MTAEAQREQRMINSLLAICLLAGFACFLLFALPDQLRKARALPSSTTPPAPTKLAAIIPLAEVPAPAVSQAGATARPAQEVLPPSPDENAQTAAGRVASPNADDDEAAGGAGAAIDDQSTETTQMLASRAKEAEASATQLDAAAGDPPQPAEGAAPKSSAPVEFKVHAVSSLSARSPQAAAVPAAAGKKGWLTTPPGLEADVAFWKDIYTKYDKSHVVLHHPRHLDIVYGVVDLTDIDNDPRLSDVERQRMRENRVDERRKAIAEVLKKLADGLPDASLTDEELRIKKLFAGVTENNMFRRAAEEDGVRSQTGQRDKFIPGLKYSGRYLGEIEAIFEAYGLPRELTRLIFVESMFNPQAVSSVGASGIWQFMRGTGKLYLQINDFVDERNDPIVATHAAAKLLRNNHDYLGSWPLAVNAYNAGRGRLAQAVAAMGTNDIGRIITGFSHPAYGFASRNFFLEFLAALDVAEHAEQYFGPIEYDRPLRYEVVRASYNLSLPDVARIASIPLEEILELNPALTPKVASGAKLLPAGFAIRLPENKSQLFLAAAARAPRSRSGPIQHTVQEGETLQEIARMYGVTPQAIVQSNKEMSWRVHRGQTLLVPANDRERTPREKSAVDSRLAP